MLFIVSIVIGDPYVITAVVALYVNANPFTRRATVSYHATKNRYVEEDESRQRTIGRVTFELREGPL